MSVVGPDGTTWPADSLRGIEHKSIRDFVERAAADGYLSDRVLDWGCGLSPYQDIVQNAGGLYEGFDLIAHPANVSRADIGEDLFWDANAWDTILCTQVAQYVPDPLEDLLKLIYERLFPGGHLVMTYPTNWPEVESADLHRFTKAGMEKLIDEAGFEIVLHERRAHIHPRNGDDLFALGYGVIART